MADFGLLAYRQCIPVQNATPELRNGPKETIGKRGSSRDIIVLVTQTFSCVNIFAPFAQKTAQKKRNFGVYCVFTRIFLRCQHKTAQFLWEMQADV
jgi:hypothetical protein